MTARIIAIAILIGIIYGVGSCTSNERQKKKDAEATRLDEMERSNKYLTQILEAKRHYGASNQWMDRIGFFSEKNSSTRELYTKDLQESMLTGEPIFVLGTIKDLKNINATEQEIYLELPLELSIGYPTKPKITFKVKCPSQKIEAIHQTFYENGHKTNSITKIQVALIAIFSEMEDLSLERTDGTRTKGIAVVGKCVHILLAPQKIGHLKSNIKMFQ